MVYRLETKKAVRRVKKIGNAHIFAAAISRNAAQRRLVDELLSFFGGRTQPVMAHLIESGRLSLEDVREAEKTLRKLPASVRRKARKEKKTRIEMTATLLANHLWQSTIVAGVAWLITMALRRNSAGARHGVWLAASLKFLVPFALLVTAGSQLGWRTRRLPPNRKWRS